MKPPKLFSYCGLLLVLSIPLMLANRSIDVVNPISISSTTTPTPSPSNENLIPILQEAMADPNCQLPCFLGLEPAKTTGSDLVEFIVNRLSLSDQSDIVSPRGAINYPLNLFFDTGDLFVHFRGRNNELSRMNVVFINPRSWLEGYNPFDLTTLLNQLGTPSNIYIALYGNKPLTASLTLVYEAQGVMVQYAVSLPDVESSTPLSICPRSQNIDRVEAWLQGNTSNNSILEYLEPSPDSPDRFGSNWTIERMTGMDIDSFVELITEDTSACLEAPSTSELYDLGYRES